MTLGEAKTVIERLIQEHGPDCRETGHFLGIKNGKPMIGHWHSYHDTYVCDITKTGIKNGFSAKDWNIMAKLLARAVNEVEIRKE